MEDDFECWLSTPSTPNTCPAARPKAERAKGRLCTKISALAEAMEGRFSAHHALLCSEMLARIDHADGAIERQVEAGSRTAGSPISDARPTSVDRLRVLFPDHRPL